MKKTSLNNIFKYSLFGFLYLFIFSYAISVDAVAIPQSGNYDCTYQFSYNNAQNDNVTGKVRIYGSYTDEMKFEWFSNCPADVADYMPGDCKDIDIGSAFLANNQTATYANLIHTDLAMTDFASNGKWICPTLSGNVVYDDAYQGIMMYRAFLGRSGKYTNTATVIEDNVFNTNQNNVTVDTEICNYSIQGTQFTGTLEPAHSWITFKMDGDKRTSLVAYSGTSCPATNTLWLCLSTINSSWKIQYNNGDCGTNYEAFNVSDVQNDGMDSSDDNYTSTDEADSVDSDCQGIMGNAVELFQKYFDWIKYGVCILLVVLGSLDFTKAVVSDDQAALKKATSSFAKRCIAAVIIFFLPYLIGLILSLPGVPSIEDALCSIS